MIPCINLTPKPADDPLKTLFMVLWTLFLLFVLYQIFKSCFSRPASTTTSTPSRPASRPSGGGWFPGHHSNGTDPPPPYSHHHKPSASESAGWTPGFWTGLTLGGLGASMWGRWRDPDPPVVPRRSFWDWERPYGWGGRSTTRQAAPPPTPSGGWFRGAGSGSRRTWSNDDRGEGTSNLGTMRSSTGWGGSSVR
jgi:store-operated calcium entry-associated regulatory factor